MSNLDLIKEWMRESQGLVEIRDEKQKLCLDPHPSIATHGPLCE